MKVRLKSDTTQELLKRSGSALPQALGLMAENALADCTRRVPYLTGALRASGKTLVSDKKAYLLWGTTTDTAKYARYQYYNEEFNYTTPGTGGRWFERTRAYRQSAWQEILAQELKRRIHR